jgi:Flp pilus assembly pilin Flp
LLPDGHGAAADFVSLLRILTQANPLLQRIRRAIDAARFTQSEESVTMKTLLRFVREDEGQDLVEYALLITFIALACIVGMQQLGTAINNNYSSISSSLAS